MAQAGQMPAGEQPASMEMVMRMLEATQHSKASERNPPPRLQPVTLLELKDDEENPDEWVERMQSRLIALPPASQLSYYEETIKGVLCKAWWEALKK